MKTQAKPYPSESLKSVDEGVKTLFDEILLATLWRKPAYLMAVYRQPQEHASAMDGLVEKLMREGYSVSSIDARLIEFDAFLRMVFAEGETDKKVYFVENLAFDVTQPEQRSWRSFYLQRDGIDSRLAKVVFWVDEEQLVTLALDTSSYWENRYQVVDFTTALEPQVEECAHGSEQLTSETGTACSGKVDLVETLFRETRENLRMGILDWRRGNLDSAHQSLRNAVDLADVLGDIEMQINCQKGLALVLMDMKSPAEAIEAYNKILELDPDSSLPWNNLGGLYFSLDDLQKAEEAFLNGLTQNPGNVVGWVGLAGVYEKMNMFQESLDSYRHALRIVPDFTLAWFRIGGILEAVKQPENAIKAYEIVIRQSAKYLPAWMRLAKIYHEQNKPEQAINTIQNALVCSPASFELWMTLGDVATRHNNNLSVSAYRKALAINPCHGQAYCRLAQVHEEQGNLLDAISCYEIGINFLETDAERARAWNALMSILARKEIDGHLVRRTGEPLPLERLHAQPEGVFGITSPDSKAAEGAAGNLDVGELANENPGPGIESSGRSFSAASEIVEVPGSFEARLESARLDSSELTSSVNIPAWYSNKKQLARELHHTRQMRLPRSEHEQIKLLTDAMLEQPRADFWRPHRKNRSHIQRQEKPIAGNSHESPLKIADFQPPWHNDKGARAWMRQGKHLLKRGFYDDALDAFANVIHAEPEWGAAYINMGITYFLSSKYDRALVQFYKGLELTNNDDEKSLAWNYIGDTYRRLHDGDNAMRAYQKISESKKNENSLRQRARRVLIFGNC